MPERLAGMDEAAFEQHPFSHGKNYPDWAAFQAEGSGAVVYYGGEIVAAASSALPGRYCDWNRQQEHPGDCPGY